MSMLKKKKKQPSHDNLSLKWPQISGAPKPGPEGQYCTGKAHLGISIFHLLNTTECTQLLFANIWVTFSHCWSQGSGSFMGQWAQLQQAGPPRARAQGRDARAITAPSLGPRSLIEGTYALCVCETTRERGKQFEKIIWKDLSVICRIILYHKSTFIMK